MPVAAFLIGKYANALRACHAKALVTSLCLNLLCASACLGVDYSFQADATLQQNFNSNILLLPNSLNPEAVWGSDIDVQTSFSAENPVWAARGNARFDNWFYYPASGLNMQNQYLDTRYSYRTERTLWEINGGYINDALLSSNSNQIQGIVFGRVQREVKSIMPSWTYRISEYTKINFSYSYFNSKYPANGNAIGNASAIYPNSTSNTVSASVSHLVSEYLSLDGVFSATAFVTQQRDIDYMNLSVGLKYLPSISTELILSGGGQLSQSTTQATNFGFNPSQSDNYFTPLTNVSLKKKFDYSAIILSYSHQSTPSINSNLFNSDSVFLSANHKFSTRLNSAFDVSYYNISSPAQGGSSLSQNTYQVGGNLSYVLTPNATVSAAYSFQLRELGVATGVYSEPQNAHIVTLSFRYNFDKITF